MDSSEENKICALCEWNQDMDNNFFCGHRDQQNIKLKHGTKYNDTCELFEEKEERRGIYTE